MLTRSRKRPRTLQFITEKNPSDGMNMNRDSDFLYPFRAIIWVIPPERIPPLCDNAKSLNHLTTTTPQAAAPTVFIIQAKIAAPIRKVRPPISLRKPNLKTCFHKAHDLLYLLRFQ